MRPALAAYSRWQIGTVAMVAPGRLGRRLRRTVVASSCYTAAELQLVLAPFGPARS